MTMPGSPSDAARRDVRGSHERQMRNHEWRFVADRLRNTIAVRGVSPYGARRERQK